MNFKPHNRRSIRIKDYNYSNIGMYFVTICVQNKAFLFGDIVDNEMILSDIGETVKQCWLNIPSHFPNVKLHNFVVMPNHIHLLITITGAAHNNAPEAAYNDAPGAVYNNAPRAAYNGAPGAAYNGAPRAARPTANVSIPRIVAILKRKTNKIYGFNMWQSSYHDHIIRNEADYQRIWQYIDENPAKWAEDCFYV